MRTFRDLVTVVVDILVNYLVPIILGIIVITFVWKSTQFILKSDNAEERSKGRMYLVYGILGLVIVLSVWSIVALFLGVIGVPPVVPQLR